MKELENTLLGRSTEYVSEYDAGLLHPFPRSVKRQELGIDESVLPFYGEDVWNGYEISWLNLKGKPVVAVGIFRFPCDSPNIIESKSFKLYLNSFNQTRFESIQQIELTMTRDLSVASGSNVSVELQSVSVWPSSSAEGEGYTLLDELDIEITGYTPDIQVLKANELDTKQEKLVSHLLKSNCPVTGQPDWATLFIEYEGPAIGHDELLQYIVGFREHQDFHEQCVERIFMDLKSRCAPSKLTVYARYTRRGGLDINPMRSTELDAIADNARMVRQ